MKMTWTNSPNVLSSFINVSMIPELDSALPVLFVSVGIANRDCILCMLDTRSSNSFAAGICRHEILKR